MITLYLEQAQARDGYVPVEPHSPTVASVEVDVPVQVESAV